MRPIDPPEWGTPEDDDQQQVMAWLDKLASECQSMADNIADAFDKYPGSWAPDTLSDMEAIHRDLMLLGVAMQKAGFMETKHVRHEDYFAPSTQD